MAKIKVDKDRDMKFTLNAMSEINKKYGTLQKMQEALSATEDPLAMVPDLIWLITLLINQSIIEHNMDIEYGVAEGKKEKLMTEEYLAIKLDLSQIISNKSTIFDSLVEGLSFSRDEETEETDEVLQEIEQQKNA